MTPDFAAIFSIRTARSRRWTLARGVLSRLLPVVAGLAGLVPPAFAQDAMYKCLMPDGRVEYTNRQIENTRNCQRLDIEPAVIVPTPRPTTPAPQVTRPAASAGTTGASPGGAANSGAGFPRVDPETQRRRDTDRRRILEEELTSQQARYDALAKEFNNGEPERRGDERNYQRYLDRVQKLKEDMARVQAEIASVKSELSRLQ